MMGRTKATKDEGDSDGSKKNSDTANTLNKEPITNEHIIAEIKIMFENFKKSLREEVEDLKKSVNFMSDKFDALHKDLSQVQEMQRANQKEIDELRYENDLILHELNELQQYSRRDNLIVHGFPEQKQENIDEVLKIITDVIGAETVINDVSVAHRLPSRSTGNPRPIVIRFSKRTSRDFWLTCYKNESKKQADGPGIPLRRFSSNFGTGRLTAGDHLTNVTRDLLTKTKEAAKLKGYKFVWTKNCKVFIRLNESSQAQKIESIYDLDKI